MLGKCTFAAVSILLVCSHLQAVAIKAVIVEAEDATFGSGIRTETVDGVLGLTAKATFTGTIPDSESTVASFSVDFPEAGDYELYARIYIGVAGANDDSFIPATSFGNAPVGDDDVWSMANGLWNVGYSEVGDKVLLSGDTTTGVWKWIRVSSQSGLGLLNVPQGQLTQTYRISTREDGLRIDKIAFGRLNVTFTVDQLDNGLDGTDNSQSGGELFQAVGPILAHNKSKFLGSVWSTTTAYNKDFEFYWNGMWHGNAGKWGSVERSRNQMNWANVDEGYEFAKANGVKFNFHVLLWGSQQPEWMAVLSPEEQLDEIKEWMAAVAERYPDIDYLQVVNEPIHAAPNGEKSPHSDSVRANYGRALGGEGVTGFDWILEGFRLARHYFPDTPLMINEYSVEGSHQRSDEYVEIIEALQAEGLIDLVGFQGHAFSTQNSSSADLKAILDKVAATGLPIMITEMEIDGHDDYAQLEEYKRVFPIYWDHPSVLGINISGHIGNWRYDQGAYLVNENFSERLALKWLREYVADSQWPNLNGYLADRGLDPELHTIAADVDQDSVPTGLEYVMGLEPSVEEFSLALWQWSEGEGRLALPLAFQAREGMLEVQRSDDLLDWETLGSYDLFLRTGSGLDVESAGDDSIIRFEGALTEGSECFYQLKYSIAE